MKEFGEGLKGQYIFSISHVFLPICLNDQNLFLKNNNKSGRMSKIPKETFRETFNEINYYKIEFPNEATPNQKGLLLGSSILINALYFENSE